jgi:Ca2+-binding EF-hand superfamily protein
LDTAGTGLVDAA